MIVLLLAALVQAATSVQTAPPAAASPATSPATVVLGAIGEQRLPDKGCAAYLWSVTDRRLVAMATAEPASIRVAIAGRTLDLTRSGGEGAGKFGFAGSAEYRGGDVTVRLTMDIVEQDGLTGGAKVPSGSLQVDRAGQDGVVVPVAGLIGCRT